MSDDKQKSEIAARKPPSGVVAILTMPDGRLISSVCSFDPISYRVPLRKMQEIRACDMLALEAMRMFCQGFVVEEMDSTERQEITNRLIRERGFVRTIIPIGHEEE